MAKNTYSPLDQREILYLLTVGYYRSGAYLTSRRLLDRTVVLQKWKDWLKTLDAGKRKLGEDITLAMLLSDNVWENVMAIVNITEPIYFLIKYCDGDGQKMGEVYERMDNMLGEIKVMRTELYSECFPQIKYLNKPAWGGLTRKSPNQGIEVITALTEAFDKIVEDPQEAELLRNQSAFFHQRKGIFATQAAQTDAVTMDAISWWSTYGSQVPQLAEVAQKAAKKSSENRGTKIRVLETHRSDCCLSGGVPASTIGPGLIDEWRMLPDGIVGAWGSNFWYPVRPSWSCMIFRPSQAAVQAGRMDGWRSTQAWSKWSEAGSWRRFSMDRTALTISPGLVDRRRVQGCRTFRRKDEAGRQGTASFSLILGVGSSRSGFTPGSGRQKLRLVWLAAWLEFFRRCEFDGKDLWGWSAGGSSEEEEDGRGGWFLILFKVVFLVKISIRGLVRFFWFLACPYSVELGLGQIEVPWMWCFSWGRIGLLLVLSYGQCADERSLHVVWHFWDTVWKRALVVLAVVYEVESIFSGFSVARVVGRYWWLGVGLFQLMEVIYGDGPVTGLGFREESGEFLSTTGHSRALSLKKTVEDRIVKDGFIGIAE
ncbi:putative mitochondria fission 1 protein [Rosa chinensis]|uniref:Putative mitochondria fission 1 protein n=1 Tax=Rosa chinensis TaxID=74649 RepID=A0A2P6Q4W6_ROSCH|nr:putative mitochondria fission 1 protein [Rosa chinensis]